MLKNLQTEAYPCIKQVQELSQKLYFKQVCVWMKDVIKWETFSDSRTKLQ